jgi:hypothetical protein
MKSHGKKARRLPIIFEEEVSEEPKRKETRAKMAKSLTNPSDIYEDAEVADILSRPPPRRSLYDELLGYSTPKSRTPTPDAVKVMSMKLKPKLGAMDLGMGKLRGGAFSANASRLLLAVLANDNSTRNDFFNVFNALPEADQDGIDDLIYEETDGQIEGIDDWLIVYSPLFRGVLTRLLTRKSDTDDDEAEEVGGKLRGCGKEEEALADIGRRIMKRGYKTRYTDTTLGDRMNMMYGNDLSDEFGEMVRQEIRNSKPFGPLPRFVPKARAVRAERMPLIGYPWVEMGTVLDPFHREPTYQHRVSYLPLRESTPGVEYSSSRGRGLCHERFGCEQYF